MAQLHILSSFSVSRRSFVNLLRYLSRGPVSLLGYALNHAPLWLLGATLPFRIRMASFCYPKDPKRKPSWQSCMQLDEFTIYKSYAFPSEADNMRFARTALPNWPIPKVYASWIVWTPAETSQGPAVLPHSLILMARMRVCQILVSLMTPEAD